MFETTAAALPVRETFSTWRIVIWALGSVSSTIIGSQAGLMTYFYVPPQTAQSDFPQYLSTQTLLGSIGYVCGILVVILNPFIANWSDRSPSPLGRRKIFMLVSLLLISILSFMVFAPPVNAAWLFAVVAALNLFCSLYGVSSALVPEFSSIGWVFGFIIGSQAVYLITDGLIGTGMTPAKPIHNGSRQVISWSGRHLTPCPRGDQDFLCTADIAHNQGGQKHRAIYRGDWCYARDHLR